MQFYVVPNSQHLVFYMYCRIFIVNKIIKHKVHPL